MGTGPGLCELPRTLNRRSSQNTPTRQYACIAPAQSKGPGLPIPLPGPLMGGRLLLEEGNDGPTSYQGHMIAWVFDVRVMRVLT